MRVLVTGGSGLVGTAFSDHAHSDIEWLVLNGPKNGGIDLCNREQTLDMFSDLKADAVVHAAARVGGIMDNIKNPADFFYKNSIMNANTLEVASTLGIKKCISFLSTCVYPDLSDYPLTESRMHSGAPHESNFAYAYSKRMLDVQSRAINKQMGYQYFCVCPNNLYGINDNFHLENSHVIPAMIRKLYESKISGMPITLWGSGTPMREFTYASDVPDVISFLLMLDHAVEGIVNIGNTAEEISISKLSSIIKHTLGIENKTLWDRTKPDGQIRKPSSSEKLSALGYNVNSFTSVEEGVEKTVEWFMENYPKVRGIE